MSNPLIPNFYRGSYVSIILKSTQSNQILLIQNGSYPVLFEFPTVNVELNVDNDSEQLRDEINKFTSNLLKMESKLNKEHLLFLGNRKSADVDLPYEFPSNLPRNLTNFSSHNTAFYYLSIDQQVVANDSSQIWSSPQDLLDKYNKHQILFYSPHILQLIRNLADSNNDARKFQEISLHQSSLPRADLQSKPEIVPHIEVCFIIIIFMFIILIN